MIDFASFLCAERIRFSLEKSSFVGRLFLRKLENFLLIQ